MKILVPVKRVIDYNVKARVRADGSGVDLANVKMSTNPLDEIVVAASAAASARRGGLGKTAGVFAPLQVFPDVFLSKTSGPETAS